MSNNQSGEGGGKCVSHCGHNPKFVLNGVCMFEVHEAQSDVSQVNMKSAILEKVREIQTQVKKDIDACSSWVGPLAQGEVIRDIIAEIEKVEIK